MSKKPRVEFWHKKQDKCTGSASQARHSSLKEGRPLLNSARSLTGAQNFMNALKVEIRKAVQ